MAAKYYRAKNCCWRGTIENLGLSVLPIRNGYKALRSAYNFVEAKMPDQRQSTYNTVSGRIQMPQTDESR